jgi:hypothetical protein
MLGHVQDLGNLVHFQLLSKIKYQHHLLALRQACNGIGEVQSQSASSPIRIQASSGFTSRGMPLL